MIGDSNNLVTRFSAPSLSLPTVDFLWVDRPTFTKLQKHEAFAGRHQTIPVLSLDHLIAMKIHALNSHDERQGRDALDIRYLLEANPGVVSPEELKALCERHGPPNAIDLITRP